MVLELCASLRRDEGWFYALPSAAQVRLLGWWRSRRPKAVKGKSKGAQALAARLAARKDGSGATRKGAGFWFGGA